MTDYEKLPSVSGYISVIAEPSPKTRTVAGIIEQFDIGSSES